MFFFLRCSAEWRMCSAEFFFGISSLFLTMFGCGINIDPDSGSEAGVTDKKQAGVTDKKQAGVTGGEKRHGM